MGDTFFRTAHSLFRRGKYPDLIRLLEPQVFRFRENFQFYYLLGMACLYTRDFGGAFSYLKRGLSLKPRNVDTLLGLAVIHLKRGQTSEAIQNWFQVLDIEPNNRFALRALKIVRKNIGPEKLSDMISEGKINRFIPGNFYFPLIPVAVIFLSVAILIGGGGYLYKLYLDNKIPVRPEIASIQIDPDEKISTLTGDFRYILTDKQIKKTFSSIQRAFQQYDDSLAQKEINKIKFSNASGHVKSKAELLEGFLKTPGFTDLKTSFSYEEVSNDPLLYENCYVIWEGRATNIFISETEITFDLLVGYSGKEILKGIVPVSLPFAAEIDTLRTMRILGKIVIDEGTLMLTGISIHQRGL